MNKGAQKLKAWRRAQRPRVRQADLPRLFGLSTITWWRIENCQQLPALETALALERAGVCPAADWNLPAETPAQAA